MTLGILLEIWAGSFHFVHTSLATPFESSHIIYTIFFDLAPWPHLCFENGYLLFSHWSDKGVIVWLHCLVSGALYIFPTLHIMGSSYLYQSMHQLHHFEEEPLFIIFIHWLMRRLWSSERKIKIGGVEKWENGRCYVYRRLTFYRESIHTLTLSPTYYT